jgi:hypothetical protein
MHKFAKLTIAWDPSAVKNTVLFFRLALQEYTQDMQQPPTTSPIPPQKLQLWLIIGFIVLLVLFAIAGAWGLSRLLQQSSNSSQPTPSPTIAQPTATPSAAPSPTTSPIPSSQSFNVYFSLSPQSNDDPQFLVAKNRTATSSGVAKEAMGSLLIGPTATEQAEGMFTSWKLSGGSSCGSDDFSLTLANQIATVRLCRDISFSGTLDSARAQAQADATLKQFPTITRVIYLNKAGNCLFDQSGDNRCLQ